VRTSRLVAVMVVALVAAAVAITVAVRLDLSVSTPDNPPTTATPAPPADPGDPVRITIPAIAVDARIVPVGLKPDGAMRTPDFGLAGWYTPGPKPGQPGPAVVVAHVDSRAGGPDVFFRLRELRAGDQVTVHYGSVTRAFTVTGTEQAAKTALPAARIWNRTPAPVLRLITCGGAFDRSAGSYLDNIIVYADALTE
jgi:sortase (surface protein transpeptidase)